MADLLHVAIMNSRYNLEENSFCFDLRESAFRLRFKMSMERLPRDVFGDDIYVIVSLDGVVDLDDIMVV